jgi:hypothetical protein
VETSGTQLADQAARGSRPRIVIVLDESLGAGHGANAAAVLAVTLSALVPGLPGPDVVDRDGTSYPGLIPVGLPILTASRARLHQMHEQATQMPEITTVAFPHFGQQTTDYAEYAGRVAASPTSDIQHVGLAFHGPRKQVSKLVGQLPLLR